MIHAANPLQGSSRPVNHPSAGYPQAPTGDVSTVPPTVLPALKILGLTGDRLNPAALQSLVNPLTMLAAVPVCIGHVADVAAHMGHMEPLPVVSSWDEERVGGCNGYGRKIFSLKCPGLLAG